MEHPFNSDLNIPERHPRRVDDTSQLSSFLRENAGHIRGFGVRSIGVFGSFVRGDQQERSDIDIFVEFAEDAKTYDNFIGLAYFLEDGAGRTIDLVTTDGLGPYTGPFVRKEVDPLGF